MTFQNTPILIKTKDKETPLFIGSYTEFLPQLLLPSNTIWITDENLFSLYGDFFGDKKTLVIKAGEISKSWEAAGDYHRQLLNMELDRSGFLIGFGGGVVTDVAGFLASTYMRGIPFGFVSTTLLGQVDAVIGGKNGVNLDGYKNLIGTFNAPEFIISDPAFFKTLPETEWISGTAEVIKQFAISDKDSLFWFEKQLDAFREKNPTFLADLIVRQSRIKAAIVRQDEREKGIRKWLNFGHSFGHAIEREMNWPHGMAVGAGMILAARISRELHLLDPQETEWFTDLIIRCKLPYPPEIEAEKWMNTLRKDKKRKDNTLDFIVLRGLGQADIQKLSFEELEILLKLVY